jgi:hypothetical protein
MRTLGSLWEPPLSKPANRLEGLLGRDRVPPSNTRKSTSKCSELVRATAVGCALAPLQPTMGKTRALPNLWLANQFVTEPSGRRR